MRTKFPPRKLKDMSTPIVMLSGQPLSSLPDSARSLSSAESCPTSHTLRSWVPQVQSTDFPYLHHSLLVQRISHSRPDLFSNCQVKSRQQRKRHAKSFLVANGEPRRDFPMNHEMPIIGWHFSSDRDDVCKNRDQRERQKQRHRY